MQPNSQSTGQQPCHKCSLHGVYDVQFLLKLFQWGVDLILWSFWRMLFVLLLNSFVIYKEVWFSLKDFRNMFFSLDTLPRYNVCVLLAWQPLQLIMASYQGWWRASVFLPPLSSQQPAGWSKGLCDPLKRAVIRDFSPSHEADITPLPQFRAAWCTAGHWGREGEPENTAKPVL